MASQAFSQKLNAFKQKCQNILGPKRQGYGELSQLEQPLVSGNDSDDAYFRAHGVQRRNPTAIGYGNNQVPGAAAADINHLQTQELHDLIDLGKDASDILWEMAALQEETPGTKDVLENVKLLQARLRGMISDYKEGNEQSLAQALEVFDRLSTSLAEYDTALSPRSTAIPPTSFSAGGAPGQPPGATLAPPRHQQNPYQPASHGSQTAPAGTTQAEEKPLISFD